MLSASAISPCQRQHPVKYKIPQPGSGLRCPFPGPVNDGVLPGSHMEERTEIATFQRPSSSVLVVPAGLAHVPPLAAKAIGYIMSPYGFATLADRDPPSFTVEMDLKTKIVQTPFKPTIQKRSNTCPGSPLMQRILRTWAGPYLWR